MRNETISLHPSAPNFPADETIVQRYLLAPPFIGTGLRGNELYGLGTEDPNHICLYG